MGKPPPDIKEFYNRFAVTTPGTGDGDDDDEAGGKKEAKGKKEKGKKEKGKKAKKGGKKDKDDKDEVIKIGPTEVITKFEEQ